MAGDDGKRLSLDKRAMTRRTALTLPSTLLLEEWIEVGRQIAVIADASTWWLGDWLIYGQDTYPDRYQRAAEQTGLAYKTLRNYAWIARRFPVSRRRDNLTMQHHAAVATLSSEEQGYWLYLAEQERWTVHQLRTHLRNDLPTTYPANQSIQTLKLQISPERQQRWEQAAERSGKELAYWMSQVLDQAAIATDQPPAISSN